MGSFRAVSYNFTATERAALSEGNNLFSSSIVFVTSPKAFARECAYLLKPIKIGRTTNNICQDDEKNEKGRSEERPFSAVPVIYGM